MTMGNTRINKKKVVVLISGGGSNLQALIDACAAADYPAEIVGVISNKADAYGLERAANSSIPTKVINHKEYKTRAEFDEILHQEIIAMGAEIVCLAGFMRLLTAEFVKKWQGRMINIHPSLLPKYKGLDTHKRAIESGDKFAGCTVHYVVPEMDAGEIILQQKVAIMPHGTVESLAKRVLEQEHIIYPRALRVVVGSGI